MKWWAFPIVTISLVAGFVFFTSQQAQSNISPPAPEKAKVLVQEIKATEDIQRLVVPVKVEARVTSSVTAEVEGLVTLIKKPLGSKVRAGETILYVENKDPAFTYAKVPVRAPVAGVVSQMNTSLMSKVSRGDKLFVITDPSSVKLTAEIPGADLSLVQSKGTKCVFKQNLEDKDGLPIQVNGISPLVDPRTGTAAAELAFIQEKGKAINTPHIGTVGHAFFEMNSGKILLVPESAIGYSDGKPVVKVVDAASIVKRKPVELGKQKETFLVIKNGIEPGEKIIVRANRSLKEGEAVDAESTGEKN